MTSKESASKARAGIVNKRTAAAKARKAIPKGHLKKKSAERRRKMGPIDRMKSYPQEDFQALTGMRRLAFRRALETGLKISRVSGKAWITGEAYYEWLSSRAESEAAEPTEPIEPDSENDEQ